ncbi:CapA family protein [Psychrobacillus lasiicapitis]|uniref:CapA family protein n=1 Tax=Psychrobacillus lasiicapitis TaxID=1636719 RepID=A0A544STX2_9BACI|nr:CapA family protein [Psychrobacillus lasiicapitis]TQR08637.1 CapA family protein [Psychrobacillus lasiicapitis]GGA45154.1 capsular polysaccharide biosynthesis protein CapA [Psychrobacillus lasiicapitis]
MKILIPLLVILVSILFYFNLQIKEPFKEKFHGKQFSTFHIDYREDTIKIGMIGDILLHHPLYNYKSFLSSFEPVKEELESLDILIANQESIPAGSEFGLSGYPDFSSPPHIIRDLKEVGVDLISMANNHTLDQEEAGVRAAIHYMKTVEMPYIGAYESFEDLQTDRIIQVDNINFGFLGYTYGTNGHDTTSDKDYLVNRIDEERIMEDISALKRKVDFVVVSIHWGAEYELEPNGDQKRLANVIADAGADIIFGHHPHVIQPYELITTSSGHRAHVFYSLGNFFSAQKTENTNVGGIAELEILKKTINGKQVLSIENPSFESTAVLRGEPFTVQPLVQVENQIGQTDKWVQQHVFGNCNYQ